MVVAAVGLVGCVKDVPSDERLEKATRNTDAAKSKDFGELLRLKCDELQPAWAKLRDEPTEERQLAGYVDLYSELHSRSSEFDRATSRNPDLLYVADSQQLVDARDQCVQMTADVRVELETKLRDIVSMPVIDDIRGNRPTKVARLNLERVREAIEKLDLEDKEELLRKLASAEKQLGGGASAKPRRREE